MASTEKPAASFEFAPEPEDTVRLQLDAVDLKLLEEASQKLKLDAGFNPYDTGVHRAIVFASRVRTKT